MKRLVYSTDSSDDTIEISEIVSVILVDDIADFSPRKIACINSSKKFKPDYSNLDREALLKLDKRQRDKIMDVDILRKLKFHELNPAQQVKVGQANRSKVELSQQEVSNILTKLKQCHRFYVEGTDKNGTFADEIYQKGGIVQDKDARNVVKLLTEKECKYGTRSTWSMNWSNLLLVFRFQGSYTFDPAEDGGQPVTETDLDLYVKIDVERKTKRGYCVMSFHRWGEYNDE